MRQLILFISKYRNTLLLIVLVAFSLLRHAFKNPVAEHRINRVGFSTIASVQNTLFGWKQYWNLSAVNEELARENAALRAGSSLKKAPAFANAPGYDYLPVQVIEFSFNKSNNHLLLNAGSQDGIEPGMGLVSSEGWVGTVVETSANFSSAIPLLHKKGSIGVRIPGKGLGELRWDGNNYQQAKLFDIQREHEPAVGDTVFSFTRANVAPPTIVGWVESARQNEEDLSWVATIRLAHDFSNMSWLYACRLIHKEDLETLSTSEQ